MFTGLIVVAIIASVLLVLIVLAQNPKGGINGQMGGATNALGAKNTTDFLEKATWALAVLVLLISVGASYSLNKKTEVKSGTPDIESIIGEDAGSDDLNDATDDLTDDLNDAVEDVDLEDDVLDPEED